MSVPSPIHRLHQEAEASVMNYGPPEAGVQVVGTYGELELEYASLRKHCVLLDQPHRAVIEVRGKDRLEFLNRMVTQELKGIEPLQVRRSFWLNRKGRIDADLRLVNLPDRVLLDVDVHAAQRAIQGLIAFIITEDVTIHSLGDSMHRLALHGPTATLLLRSLAKGADGQPVAELSVDRAAQVTIAGAPSVVFREDSTGETGLELIVPAESAVAIWQQLIETGHDHNHGAAALRGQPSTLGAQVRLRPAGWHAFNIARIEAGTPLYNIDFGPESLPAESGVLKDRVSFTKGCYLGQEVVARMHSRGHSKQVLVGIKFETLARASSPSEAGMVTDPTHILQPITGSRLYPLVEGEPGPEPIGAITSSTISPMLSSSPIAFAAVKQSHAAVGTELCTPVEARNLRGAVQRSLRMWNAEAEPR